MSIPIHPIEKNIALRFDGVSFSYEKVKVLEGMSFHIHQGEFVALIGPNGSGKTTVLKLLLGLETPQSGSIELFGARGSKRDRERIGYVPQQAQLDRAFPITVEEVVKMGRLNPLSRKFSGQDRGAVKDALDQAEIGDLASRPYSALSGGQRRRVLVARALAARPGILILDEPTANMDTESEERLFKTLGKLKGNTTVLIVTHDTEFVSSLVDRVLCMGVDERNSRGAESSNFTIVQHRLETGGEADGSHGNSSHGSHSSRVLHGESIPADSCFSDDKNSGGGQAE
jgi:zinc transport system ATP-binding protein